MVEDVLTESRIWLDKSNAASAADIRVIEVREEMTDVLRQLFHRFMDNPDQLPHGWDASKDDFARARLVADYVSGMTDRYALKLFHGN